MLLFGCHQLGHIQHGPYTREDNVNPHFRESQRPKSKSERNRTENASDGNVRTIYNRKREWYKWTRMFIIKHWILDCKYIIIKWVHPIMGDKLRVGRHDGSIQKKLYKKVVLPTITYNMETTTNLTNKKWRKWKWYKAKWCGKHTTYLHQLHTGGYWLNWVCSQYNIFKRLMLYTKTWLTQKF